MSWPTQKFASLVADTKNALVGGPFGSKLTTRDYVDDGVPVIRGANMSNGRFILEDDFVFITDEKKRKDLQSNLARPGDLIFTQRGTLGQVAIIPPNATHSEFVVSQSQMKATLDPKKADTSFYYYFFSSNKVVDSILKMASSSGVPHINLGTLKDFEIPVPDLPTQERIASILSAYDDLIENNRRRIACLEQAARLLYREWFVHLRFPGHETAKIVDGLPEGWRKATLSSYVELVKDTVQPDSFRPDDVHIGLEHIPRRSFVLSNWEPADRLESHKFRFKAYDIIFGKIRPYFHKVGFALRNGIASSDAFVWRVRDQDAWSLILCATSSDHFVSVASKTVREGSKMPRADWKVLAQYEIPRPSDELLSEFDRCVRPIAEDCRNLSLQNCALSRARDLLLPRLMDGRLRV